MTWRVLATKGCGSAIVEAVLSLAELPYGREEHDYATNAGHDALIVHNPLAQVPTVILPDGSVMTESMAIALHVAELVPAAELMPAIGDPLRKDALRWLAFFVAAIYPTFSYGDDPAKWGSNKGLRAATDTHRQELWRYLEASVVRGPWFLGERLSVLDVYVAVMTRWRPRRAWFAEACPKLHTIAVQLDRDPRLAAVWAVNFPHN
jgi:GST-like protein